MSGYTADVIAHHGVLDAGVHFIQKPFSRRPSPRRSGRRSARGEPASGGSVTGRPAKVRDGARRRRRARVLGRRRGAPSRQLREDLGAPGRMRAKSTRSPSNRHFQNRPSSSTARRCDEGSIKPAICSRSSCARDRRPRHRPSRRAGAASPAPRRFGRRKCDVRPRGPLRSPMLPRNYFGAILRILSPLIV